jgi:hypothetical protein
MDPRETPSPAVPERRRPEILSYLFFAGLVATTFLL